MRRLTASTLMLATLLSLSACGGGSSSNPVASLQAQEMPTAVTPADTGRELDMAILGDGQFIWRDSDGATVYSREAGLGLRTDGTLINRSGAALMGLPEGADDGDALQVLTVNDTMTQVATTQVQTEFNLDSRQSVTDRGGSPRVDFRDGATFNDAMGVTVIDDDGGWVYVTFYFQKSAEDRWNVYVIANNVTQAGTEAEPQPVTTLQFPADGGNVTAEVEIAIAVPTSSYLGNTTSHVNLVWMIEATQYGSPFGSTVMQANGHPFGQLTRLDVTAGGQLVAQYSNGRSQASGRVMLARFAGDERFLPTGQGWRQVRGAAPLVTAPGLGLCGTVRAGVLETDAQLHTLTSQ